MLLGYSDHQVKLVAGRTATQRVLRKNKISDDQMEIILAAADALRSNDSVVTEITSLLCEGKLDKAMRPLLQQFITVLEEE